MQGRTDFRIGMPRLLNTYTYSPFFNTYFASLGLKSENILKSDRGTKHRKGRFHEGKCRLRRAWRLASRSHAQLSRPSHHSPADVPGHAAHGQRHLGPSVQRRGSRWTQQTSALSRRCLEEQVLHQHNHKVWAAKFTARHPNLVAFEVSSFECGHDAPIYGVIESIIESSGTTYFSSNVLNENKLSGSIRIRVETTDYFLRYREDVIACRKTTDRLEEDPKRYVAQRTSDRLSLQYSA